MARGGGATIRCTAQAAIAVGDGADYCFGPAAGRMARTANGGRSFGRAAVTASGPVSLNYVARPTAVGAHYC